MLLLVQRQWHTDCRQPQRFQFNVAAVQQHVLSTCCLLPRPMIALELKLIGALVQVADWGLALQQTQLIACKIYK